jgi:uncharacterized protein (TIGR00299 family) protein
MFAPRGLGLKGTNGKTIHFDCFAGISGDMVLGALFSLGVEPSAIESGIRGLGIEHFSVKKETVDRSGISSIRAVVHAPDEKNHRHLPEIERMIDGSNLSPWVKGKSKDIFRNLAEAEAKVHGITLDKVHFHEVGALDSIIDVVGACIGFEVLGATGFSSSSLHVGSGFVDMAHGKFPVPPPAVAELLTDIPFYSTDIQGELVTPTGAAIVATLCERFGPQGSFRIAGIGYGAGGRDYKGFPNTLRMMLGTESSEERFSTESLALMETNIDDLDGEAISFAMERILSMGALDCWFTPIQMKKSRPATTLSILVKKTDADRFGEILLNETSTLGYRLIEVSRICLRRTEIEVESEFGPVSVKVVERPNGKKTFKVEHDVLRELAVRHQRPLAEIRDLVNGAASRKLGVPGE